MSQSLIMIGRLARNLVLSSLLALAVGSAADQSTAPTWAKADHFWYRRAVSGGHLWLTVDAQHGVRQPLFDHQRLAIELSLRTGAEYTPLTLPFADPAAEFVVKYDGSNAYIQVGAMAIEFILDGQHWRCELEIKWDWNKVPPTDYECLPRRPVAPERTPPALATPRPVVSPDGRWEAFVQNHNVAIRAAKSDAASATMLSSDGTATQAYQQESIRWSPDGTKLTAYRVSEELWQSDSVAGTVKSLIAKGEWTVK
jgi:Dipeptidyl peptidase IV (DPP IV) N-terminal region